MRAPAFSMLIAAQDIKYIVLFKIADYGVGEKSPALLFVRPHIVLMFKAQLYGFCRCFAEIYYEQVG